MNIRDLKAKPVTREEITVPGHRLADAIREHDARGFVVAAMQQGGTNGVWILTLLPKTDSQPQ